MTDRGANDYCPHCHAHASPRQHAAIALPFATVLNNRFLVGRVLGRPGGFGITYLAWDMVLETTAAIKEFLPLASVSREPGNTFVQANSDQDQAFLNQGLRIFLHEAQTLAQFSHPNIIRIRDYFTANSTAYLVMDYHQGRTIDHYLRECGGRLSEQQTLSIMLPILSGLEAVHAKGFLHRDIKPQNIYLTCNDVPILLDFGAARVSMRDSVKTLTVMHTAGFAPFEQYHKKGWQGPWTDIYACGATLYYLSTGKMPADAIERQYDDQLAPPNKYNPLLSVTFSETIMASMSISPAKRPRTIALFRKRLLAGEQSRLPETDIMIPMDRSTSSLQSRKRSKTPNQSVRRYENSKLGQGSWLLIAALTSFPGFIWYAGHRDTGRHAINHELEPAHAPRPKIQVESENETPSLKTRRGIATPYPDRDSLDQPVPKRSPHVQFYYSACQGKRWGDDCQQDANSDIWIGMCLQGGNRELACFPKTNNHINSLKPQPEMATPNSDRDSFDRPVPKLSPRMQYLYSACQGKQWGDDCQQVVNNDKRIGVCRQAGHGELACFSKTIN